MIKDAAMLASAIFISHASEDDAFVKNLRIALEGLRLPLWVDSRWLRGGAKLAPEIREAIEQARQVAERLNIERSDGWIAVICPALFAPHRRCCNAARLPRRRPIRALIMTLLCPVVDWASAAQGWYRRNCISTPG